MASLEENFARFVFSKKAEIEALVRSELRVPHCHLAHYDVWSTGSSHLAIPCHITPDRRVYFRIPLPHEIDADGIYTNNDEFISTHAATYIFIGKHCPDVPIPALLAFGFNDGRTFTDSSNCSFWQKQRWNAWRLWTYCRTGVMPIDHVLESRRHTLGFGFSIISSAKGQSVALSWNERCSDEAYRSNLFRDIARVQLSLAATPFAKIGSLRLEQDASIALTNRPFTAYIMQAEKDGLVTGIPPDRTYSSASAYLSDLLSFQENVHRDAENAEDDRLALARLRDMIAQNSPPAPENELFQMMLTEIHMPNIFIDDDGHIETIIDVETAALPSAMLTTPRWLVLNEGEIPSEDECKLTYEDLLNEYIAVFKQEQALVPATQFSGSKPAIEQIRLYSAVTMPHAMEFLMYYYFPS
ncbi:hypothetical protein MY11210_009605 [Beauveria gryllotalpidicola]